LNKQNFGSDNPSKNTGVGAYAGYYNVTGTANTCIGYEAGFSTSSASRDYDNNTFVGNAAGKAITTGSNNTLLGAQSGEAITEGASNVTIGHAAGNDCITGNYNIFIGKDSNPATESHSKQIGIGYSVGTSASEQIRMGDSSHYLTYDYSSGGAVSITSDERIKKDIVDTDLGLEFINELRPIKYKEKAIKDWPRNFSSKKITDSELNKEPKNTVWDGFLAQEVKAAADKLGLNYSGWTEDAGMGGRQELDYARFVVPLVKAVQELSQQVEDLKKQINK